MNILKVFAPRAQIPAVLQHARLIEKYDAFVVVEAGDVAARLLARTYPIEDITGDYRLQLAGRRINTLSALAPAAAARTRPSAAGHGRRPSKPWAASKLKSGRAPLHRPVHRSNQARVAYASSGNGCGAA
jgi:hypothetical protein